MHLIPSSIRWTRWLLLLPIPFLVLGAWLYFTKPRPIAVLQLAGPYSTRALSFSPDGRFLAFGDDRKVKFWDVITKRVEKILQGESYSKELRFSPDGKTLVSVEGGRGIVVWNLETGERRKPATDNQGGANLFRESEDEESPVRNVKRTAFSPDGKWLATRHVYRSSHPGGRFELRVWEMSNGDLLKTITDREDSVRFAFSPDGTLFASCGDTKEIKLTDTSTWQSTSLFDDRKSRGSWHFLAFTPDGRFLTYGGGWGGLPRVYFWETSSGKETSPLRYDNAGESCVLNLAFSPNGKTLATGLLEPSLMGRSKYEVILWNWSTAEVVAKIPCDESPDAISFSPDGKLLAVEEGFPADHLVKIWNVATMLK